MATGSLYGSSAESTGLYGIGAASGGTYFEWFIFQDSATAPANPTGGSWSFSTNTGVAPTGWVNSPPPAPVNQVWVSIAVVDSRNVTTLVWSTPGLMTGSGLPILTGSGVPSSGTGLNGQLYINTATTPQSLYNKQAGAWVQLTGSNLVDLVNNQTIGGVKTFSQTIQGSISGTASNVSGIVAVANGGTGATTASDARTNLGLGTLATQSASAVAITGGSITGITDLAVADGGTGASTASQARINLDAVGLSDTQTLTNKSISGSTNTLSNIPNSALTNSSLNINGVNFTLGAVQTIGPNWILPSYAGNAGKVLAVNPSSSDVQWIPAAGVGTVTSIDVSGGTTGLTYTGGPITAAGTVTMTGVLNITNGGTGQTTANAAFNALVPLQTGNSGKYLTTNGTDTSWADNPLGTVSSVNASGGTTGLAFTGGPITTSGTLTLSGTLAVANGGTGVTTSTGTGNVVLSTSPALTTPSINLINDTNGNEILGLSPTASATDYLTVKNGIGVGVPLHVYADGPSANIGLHIQPKGTGLVTISDGTDFNKGIRFRSSGSAAGVTTLIDAVSSAGHVVTLPDATTTLVGRNTTDTLTNKTFGDNPTFSAGTANGVAYLNGSKVLTTGSALTFDGTTVGVQLPGRALNIGTTSAANFYSAYRYNSADIGYIGNGPSVITAGTSATDFAIGTASTNPLLFAINGTEGMRLTSTGLGIGTSSPIGRLAVVGSAVGAGVFSVDTDATRVDIQSYNKPLAINRQGNNTLFNEGGGNVGIGTSSVTNAKLKVSGAGAAGAIMSEDTDGTTSFVRILGDVASQNLINWQDGTALRFATSTQAFGSFAERMRIDASGNVGIGTSSPAYKLDARASAGVGIQFLETSSGSTNRIQLGAGGGLGYINADAGAGAIALALQVGGTTKATLDGSGNLGLGVTPSAWFSNRTAIQLGNSVGVVAAIGYLDQYCNGYIDSGTVDRYYQSGIGATKFSAGNGAFQWYTAPSGTAGNAISFTQAMTLDASGNLGVGITSPTQNGGGGSKVLHVNAAGASDWSTIHLTNGTTGTTGSDGFVMGLIGSDGNAQLFNYENTAMVFSTNAAERARIDSSGNLLVGQTANGLQNSNSVAITPSAGDQVVLNKVSGSGSGNAYVVFGLAGTQIGSITQNGTTGVLYNITSDYRLKTVIGPVANAGQRIDALQPVEYTWNADGSRTRGFLAHQFQEIYAGSVIGSKDAVDAEGKPVYQAMQASSSEVIADLVAEIQSLRQRLAAAGI